VYPHLRGGNPFNVGIIGNLKEFFGMQWWLHIVLLINRRFWRSQLEDRPDIHKEGLEWILSVELCGEWAAGLRKRGMLDTKGLWISFRHTLRRRIPPITYTRNGNRSLNANDTKV
jgi:hypothetical protein